MCCGCMQPSEACPCQPTDNPAEGCHGIDFQRVREPEGQDSECE
jgi:hypothetical protein